MTEAETLPPETPPSPPPPPPPPPLPALHVVVPLHGAPAEVVPALERWAEYLSASPRPWQLSIYADGVQERADVVIWANDRPGVVYHASAEPCDLGIVVRSALATNQHPLIAIATLDYPYDPADLTAMLQRIDEADPETKQTLDLVNGFRAGRPTPIVARISGAIWRGWWNLLLDLHLERPQGWLGLRWNWLAFRTRILFGLRLRDPSSGFKLFRSRIFPRIPIQSNGSFVFLEVLAKANFLGCFMDELPVAVEAGKTSPPIPKLGNTRADFRAVFWHPDFGPAILPAPPETPAHAEGH